MTTQHRHIGRVLRDVLALGARLNSERAECKGLVILHRTRGQVVTAWALYPHVTERDVWTRGPTLARALVRLRDALERS